MKDNYTSLNNIIEKLINLRLNEIIEKVDLNEKLINKIKDTNNIIANENKMIKKKKNNVEKKDKKLSIYTTFVKDANNIIKDNPNLNYVPNDVAIELNKLKNKPAKEQFKELGIIWKTLDNKIVNKYKDLTKNNEFTNEKYNETVGKTQTPKIPRKKKSKDSLKV
jgi:hypothetical protein